MTDTQPQAELVARAETLARNATKERFKLRLATEDAALQPSPASIGPMRDETGWLVEENATGVIHWIALAQDEWPRTKENRFSRRFGFEDYLSPVVRVKDSNEALRFARKEDAEAFIALFRIFLLCPVATEHCWTPLPPAQDAGR